MRTMSRSVTCHTPWFMTPTARPVWSGIVYAVMSRHSGGSARRYLEAHMSDQEAQNAPPVLAKVFSAQRERTGLDAHGAWFKTPVFLAWAGNMGVQPRQLIVRATFADVIAKRLIMSFHASGIWLCPKCLTQADVMVAEHVLLQITRLQRCRDIRSQRHVAMKTGLSSESVPQAVVGEPVRLIFDVWHFHFWGGIFTPDEQHPVEVWARERRLRMTRPFEGAKCAQLNQVVVQVSTGGTSQRSRWLRDPQQAPISNFAKTRTPIKQTKQWSVGEASEIGARTFGINKPGVAGLCTARPLIDRRWNMTLT